MLAVVPLAPEAPEVTYTSPSVNGVGQMQYDVKDWGQLGPWDALLVNGQIFCGLDFQLSHVRVTHC